MSRDRRKGLIAGYKKAGPTLRFTIKAAIAAIILAFVFFAIQIWQSASKELQEKAQDDRDSKHREILAKENQELLAIVEVKKSVQKIVSISDFVDSSAVDVFLKITVNKKTQRDFNGRISGRVDECYLQTQSGREIGYVSEPGATSLVRSNRQYEFSFKAKLPPEKNPYCEKPEEFAQARRIRIPLIRFLNMIKSDLSSDVECTLAEAKIGFYVNNNELL